MDDNTATKIQENFVKFEKLCKRLGNRTAPVKELLEHYGERLALCPASSRTEYHNAFPGGLVEHSLRVFKNAGKICSAMGYDIPLESLVLASLFHDFGKVGDRDNERYLPQKSDWHRERGMVYEVNHAAMLMPVPQQGLFNMQEFGIKMSKDEYLGILLHDGQYVDENKPYAMKEPLIALVLHQADRLAGEQEKQMNRKGL